MNKHTILNIILLVITISFASIIYAFCYVKKEPTTRQGTPIEKEVDEYNESCYTSIKKDTLIHLLNVVYGKSILLKEKASTLEFSFVTSNQSAPAFYNGNQDLLNYKLDDHGFQITPTSSGLTVKFTQNNGAINVPNDILLKLVSRLNQTN